MQVFIIGTPLETAQVLSERHLNNQINEASIILDALNGKKAWSNHPCVLQYRGYGSWLIIYRDVLKAYQRFDLANAILFDTYAERYRPIFHTQEYFDQMKRRLYTKNPEHYKQWAHLGTSLENWYWSPTENKFIKYVNGKRIE